MNPPDEPRDGPPWAALDRARGGDREAFAVLYDHYLTTVYRYIYRWVAYDRELAEDLTSETFLRALRAIGTYRDQGRDPQGWFLRIARNIVLDHVKSARVRLVRAVAEPPEPAGPATGPDEEALGRISVAAALAGLSEDQLECVILRVLEDRSVVDTAAAMGKSVAAVKALYWRAVRRLAARHPGGTL